MCSCETCVKVTLVTFEQCVHAYVAEGEANDGGFVQVSPNRGLEWQETRQISEHIRLNSSPPSGCFTADRPEEEGQMKNTSQNEKQLSL